MGMMASTPKGSRFHGPLSAELAAAAVHDDRGQDRYFITQREGVTLIGVFDGHSPAGVPGGDIAAEAAAMHFVGLLDTASLWRSVSEEKATALELGYKELFRAYQRNLETEFEKNVVKPLQKQKREVERELGDTVTMDLPQEGGTTATLVIITRKFIYTAWLGDSEALVARTASADKVAVGKLLEAELLTLHKHQVSYPPEERRVKEKGGALFGGAVYVQGVQGGLRVTRSLGDCAMHKNDIISHEPEFCSCGRTESDAFAVIGSDGLWDAVPYDQVVDIVGGQLQGTAGKLQESLVAARDKLLRLARESVPARQDDVTVVIVVLNSRHPLFTGERMVPAHSTTESA